MKILKKYWIAIFLLCFSLIPLLWFIGKGNVLISGSDTNFPLDPLTWFARRFFVWNSIANGGANFASSIAGIFFHSIQIAPYLLGLNLQLVEIISLIFWFSIIVFASFTFSGLLFPDKKLPRLIFVGIYTLNIYMFNTWENIKVANLALVSTLPIFLWVLINTINKKFSFTKSFLLSVIFGVVASGAGINPAYFLTIILGLFLTSLAFSLLNRKREQLFHVWKSFAVVVLGMVLINCFWIIPTMHFLFFSGRSIRGLGDIGYTNWLSSLSENTSISNILRLQGAWDWYSVDDAGAPLYIPYSVNFFRNPIFIVFSFLLSGAAIGSFVFRNTKKSLYYVLFGIMMVLGIFLGVGAHSPTGTFYLFLTTRLPFLSFFRSPWYIFTPILIISLAGLVSLFFEQIEKKLKQPLIYWFFGLSIIGLLLYNYPLVSGKIFRPGRQDGFYITYPNYIYQAKDYLSKTSESRIIGYPDDGIERFVWGYNAVETVLTLFSSRETLFTPISDTNSPLAKMLSEFYLSLKKNRISAALNIASRLNGSTILYKKDQSSLAPSLPDKITSLPKHSFGGWDFYDLPDASILPKIYSSTKTYMVYPFNEAYQAAGLDNKSLLLSPTDSIVNRIYEIKSSTGEIITTINSQQTDFENYLLQSDSLASRSVDRDLSEVSYTFETFNEGIYKPVLENYSLESFGINTQLDIAATLDDQPITLKLDTQNDSSIFFEPISLSAGKHELVLSLVQQNLAIATQQNDEEDVLEKYLITDFDPMQNYLIKFNYNYLAGDIPMVIMEQKTKSDPVKRKTENLPRHGQPLPISFYFDPVRTDSSVSIKIFTPYLANPLGTKIDVSNFQINKVFSNKLFLIKENETQTLSLPEIDFKQISPVEYIGEVKSGNLPHVIIFSENYSPDWVMEISEGDTQAIENVWHFTANTYANAWFMRDYPEQYSFRIYYKPQNNLYIGAGISIFTIVFAFVLWFTKKARK